MASPSNDLFALGAVALGRELRAGRRCPVEVAAAFLERASGDTAGAVSGVLHGRAMREAQASRARLRAGAPLGPLDGVPLLWKDNFDLQGERTVAGSLTRLDVAPADRDASAVARAAAGGTVCLARTHMSELAFHGLGINLHFATPQGPSPDGVRRLPGGSSSGAAVGVAQGLAPLAVGSDTSGSVRVPAAFQQLAGYRPSLGRHPVDGLLPVASSMDVPGPLARRVEDLLALDTVLAGLPARERPAGVPGRLLVPTNLEAVHPLDEEVAAGFEAALGRLSAAGWTLVRRPLRALDEVVALFREHGTLVAAEAARYFAPLLDGPRAKLVYWPVLRRLVEGSTIRDATLALLRERRAPLAALLREELGDCALAVLPTTPVPAPEWPADPLDAAWFARTNRAVLALTMPFSYLDAACASLPCGGASGLQVVAPSGEDDRLLDRLADLERALG